LLLVSVNICVHLILFVFYPCVGDSDIGSSFWGMVLILASTKLLTAKIAAGCFIAGCFIVLFVAKNVGNEHRHLFQP